MKRWMLIGGVAALALMLATGALAEDLFFDSDGVQIRYMTRGEGEPVVLIHGFTANIEMNWIASGILDQLSSEFKVIALDTRGHGKSGKPHGKEHYGKQMAKDVINLLDELGIEKAHIVGYSMGGFLTTNITMNYPERVISAVPGAFGWTPPGDPAEAMPDLIAEALETGQGIAPLITALTPAGSPPATPEQIEMMTRMVTATNDVLALAAVMRGFRELNVTEDQLRANTVPIRAIVGEIDPLKAGVDAMARVTSNFEMVVVPGGDHMTTVGNPALLQGIQEFLRAHSLQKMTREDAPALAVGAASGL